jgi:hypothetical protein
VVETSSLNTSDPGEVPRVHVVPPVASDDLTFNVAVEPSLVTVCVSPFPAVVVAVLRETEPNAIVPSDTETARLVAVTVAETVSVSAALEVFHPKTAIMPAIMIAAVINTLRSRIDMGSRFCFILLNMTFGTY